LLRCNADGGIGPRAVLAVTPCRRLLLVVRSKRQAPSRLLRPPHVACGLVCLGGGGNLIVDGTPWAVVRGGHRGLSARGRLDVLRLLRTGQRRLFGRWYAGQSAPRGVGSLGRLALGPQRPQPGR